MNTDTAMELEIEQSADRLKGSLPAPPQEKRFWLVDQVTILTEAFDQTMTAERLRVYVEDLADLDLADLGIAFIRARRELTFLPKIAELRELAGAGTKTQQDAEARRAWDLLEQFVHKYVSNDVHGNFGPEHGWYPTAFLKLSQRVLDTVRRTGGWIVYKRMTDEDFPFVQKRFFEEYKAWTAVEQTLPSKLLTETPVLQLIATPMDTPRTEPQLAPIAQKVVVKKVPEALTEAQIPDRRETLRQQTELIFRSKNQAQSAPVSRSAYADGNGPEMASENR